MQIDPVDFATLVSRLQLIATRGDGFGREDISLIYQTVANAVDSATAATATRTTFGLGGLEMLIVAVRNDRKIEAIKQIRTLTGLGLKESKDLVERAMSSAFAFTRDQM